jgi:5S rRNA maturation endonuclease (ribonuclease M5)
MVRVTDTAYERILDRLHDQGKKVRVNGTKATAQCPAHDDRNPSLVVTRIEGSVLVHCHVGCQIDDILVSLEMRRSDLYDDARGYDYHYADGATAHRSYGPDGKKRFYQSGTIPGAETTLYRADKVEAAKLAGQAIYMVEGENDVHALESIGVVATTNRGGADGIHKADLTPLHGAKVITVVDKDAAGDKWAQNFHNRIADKATLTFVQSAEGKDAADHVAAGYGIADFQPYTAPVEEPDTGRWLNLDEYLDGNYTPPQPSVGAARDDDIQLLYPGRWHTVIGLMTAGKTSFALWQVKAVLAAGWHVIYVHFEEPDPGGIIHRLLGLGVDKEVIRKRFHWADDPTSTWEPDEMARQVALLEDTPALAVLDGINAACGIHSWDVSVNAAVGAYRNLFVFPLTKLGVAVLSLGHPPKAPNRQGESYGYGAAGWLNDVDGVGYRMTASKQPITKGGKGSSALHIVKDRYGEVQRWCNLQTEGKDLPWWYVGQAVVDDTKEWEDHTAAHLSVPARPGEEGAQRDKYDDLGDHVIAYLKETETHRFESQNKLAVSMRAKGIKVPQNDLEPALERLANNGAIVWPDKVGRSRTGWLADVDEEL